MVVLGLRAWSDGETLNAAALVYPGTVPVGTVPSIIVAPRAGIVRNMFSRAAVAPGVGETLTFTLFVNEVATALTVVLTGAALSGSDLVNAVPVNAGDRLEIGFERSPAAAEAEAVRTETEFA